MADTNIQVLNRYRDATLAAFEQHLEQIIRAAQQATIQYVTARLEITDGVVVRTPANLKLIRNLNQIFMKQLDQAGYNSLINAFVGEFSGSLPLMQESIKSLSDASKVPLPDLGFTVKDLNLFKSVAVSAAQSISGVIETEATRALNRVLFSLGGLPFKDMVSIIQSGFGATISRAKVIADTAQAQFYRIAQERQYEKIEDATGKALLYRYTGPLDNRCRAFCRVLKTNQQKTWTRAEIDQMQNGQIPNVFVSAGGWLCRHDWSLAGFSK